MKGLRERIGRSPLEFRPAKRVENKVSQTEGLSDWELLVGVSYWSWSWPPLLMNSLLFFDQKGNLFFLHFVCVFLKICWNYFNKKSFPARMINKRWTLRDRELIRGYVNELSGKWRRSSLNLKFCKHSFQIEICFRNNRWGPLYSNVWIRL